MATQREKSSSFFSIDDVHPSKNTHAYEVGGDLVKGSLGLVQWLLKRHPKSRSTLFVTADWREISPVPTRKIAAKIPFLKDKM